MNYIVSTIQYNAVVNKNLLRNLLAFADKHKVDKIYLYVMAGKTKDETLISQFLTDKRIEFIQADKNGIKLNDNLKLYDTRILASQINCLAGFNKKLHRDYCYILPSPKIRYKSVANTSKYPRFLASTGALTYGNYKMHTAQGRKADLEHQFGFAFVHVRNSRLFDYVPVEATKNGNFSFMREAYISGKVVDQQPEALVLGDIHVGDTEPKALKASEAQIESLKPKRVMLHDLFNGHSINHHERNNNLSKAKLWQNKTHVLEEEVEQCLKELNRLAFKFPDVKFIVVESNHDIFLSKYIGNENFLIDGQNSRFSCQLFIEVLKDRKEPILKTALELTGKVAKNVQFLNEDDDYRVQGIGLGHHGHRGVNGARGTGASFSNNNLMLITGHSHSPELHPKGMVVGTLTKLKLDYSKGPSSWLNANGLLYPSGKYTLLTLLV